MDDRALTSAEQVSTHSHRLWLMKPGEISKRLRFSRLSTLVSAITAVVLAGSVAFPTAAQANVTQGFHVYDLSPFPLKLIDVLGDSFEGSPPIGSILRPGVGYQNFELIYRFLASTGGTAFYARVANDGSTIPGSVFAAQMLVTSTNVPRSRCATTFTLYSCAPGWPDWSNDDRTLTFQDKPGTVIDVPAGKGQEQAGVLKQFCAESNRATCTFTARKRERIYSTQQQVGQALVNETSETQDLSTKIEDTVGSSDSLGGELKVGGEIAKIVSIEVTARYEHQWTQQHTFGQEVSIHCPAHHKCWIEGTVPMFRDTGDFKVSLGNTTWQVRSVYFDSPNPSEKGAFRVRSCLLGTSACVLEGDAPGG
jgi:hypothetical protein